LRTWADLLENNLLAGISLPDFAPQPIPVPTTEAEQFVVAMNS
jgi:hypothetical protein